MMDQNVRHNPPAYPTTYPNMNQSPYPPNPSAFPQGQGAIPYPPNVATPYPTEGQQNFIQPNFGGGMYPAQGQMNVAPQPNQGGFDPVTMNNQWTAHTGSVPSAPTQAGTGAVDIGFNFRGTSLPGYIDSSLNPTIQPPTNPFFGDDYGQGDTGNNEARPLLPVASATTENEANAALEAYAKDKTCRKKPEGIRIGEIEMKSGFKYSLTSTKETRETVWEFEPYDNQKMDGPLVGHFPSPWDLEVHPASSFSQSKKEIHIPGTSSIKPCHSCAGNGRTRCETCEGLGGMKCTWCNGSGKRFDEQCDHCFGGSGRTRCTTCTGTAMVTCKTCKGKQQLYTYLKLIVKWDLLEDKFVSADSPIPDKYLTKKSKGIEVVKDSGKRIRPVTNFPDEAINTTSQNLIDKQVKSVMPNGAIREQKHSVEMIKIAEVKYDWDDKNGVFYVFGENNNVYFKDYPRDCCGCCSIC